MSSSPEFDMKEWLARWRRVGPILERIEREELRNYDFAANRDEIESLLEIGVQHAQPRDGSGLVELQRRLRELFE
ncbi:MAG: hypothetical protein WED34_20910 [Planctomycetales bacterium]